MNKVQTKNMYMKQVPEQFLLTGKNGCKGHREILSMVLNSLLKQLWFCCKQEYDFESLPCRQKVPALVGWFRFVDSLPKAVPDPIPNFLRQSLHLLN